MRKKRCLRARGIHDLATRQQFLSASLLSCRRSTTSSSNSARRHGHDMVVGKLERKRWKMTNLNGNGRHGFNKISSRKKTTRSDHDGLSSTHGSRIDRHPLQLVTRCSFGQVMMTSTNGTIHPDEKKTSLCTFNKFLSRFSSPMPQCRVTLPSQKFPWSRPPVTNTRCDFSLPPCLPSQI